VTTATSITLRVSPAEFFEVSRIEPFRDNTEFAARIAVGSEPFACSDHPFYFDQFPRFACDIKDAYERVEGTARLGHTYEKDFLEIAVLSGGHVFVAGSLVEHGPLRQELSFAFDCDQTFLPELLRSLDQVARELGIPT